MRSSRHSRRRLACAAALLAFLLPATPAAAAPVKAIWGPAQVNGASQFPIYEDLGVDLFQITVNWRTTAPTRPANPTDPNDPAYRWPADLDLAVAEGSRTGIGVLAMVMWTPEWAQREPGMEARHPPVNVQDYARFMEALARRYPTIRHFMVWGEPHRIPNYGLPVTGDPKPGPPKAGERPGSILPRTTAELRRVIGGYARMVDATYARLKALNRSNLIIAGNTTTDGDMDPFNFIKWMRLGSGKPPRMDLFGHNPFGTRGPDITKPMLRRATADMSDLDDYQPWVKRWMQRSGRNGKLRLFISEYTAPTDVASFEFGYHVTRAVQAKWLRQAWNVAKRERLYGFGWIGLYDVAVRADGGESRTGLIDAAGVHKPAYDVFKSLR